MQYFDKVVYTFSADNEPTGTIDAGEKILITGPTTGAVYLELEDPRVELQSVETAHKGERVSFKVPGKVRPSDKLYKIVSTGSPCS